MNLLSVNASVNQNYISLVLYYIEAASCPYIIHYYGSYLKQHKQCKSEKMWVSSSKVVVVVVQAYF